MRFSVSLAERNRMRLHTPTRWVLSISGSEWRRTCQFFLARQNQNKFPYIDSFQRAYFLEQSRYFSYVQSFFSTIVRSDDSLRFTFIWTAVKTARMGVQVKRMTWNRSLSLSLTAFAGRTGLKVILMMFKMPFIVIVRLSNILVRSLVVKYRILTIYFSCQQ